MSKEIVESGIERLAMSRGMVTGFADAIPEKDFFHQPCKDGNHAMWILGHIAWADDFFMIKTGGRDSQLPANYTDLFGMGSKVHTDASRYPSVREVKDALASTRESLVNWLRAMNDAQLNAAPPEDFLGFFPTFAALPASAAIHEGMHAGQLTVIRRSLGLAPLM